MDPTKRFTARADVYAQARPTYPKEVLEILRAHHGLRDGAVIADLGSGSVRVERSRPRRHAFPPRVRSHPPPALSRLSGLQGRADTPDKFDAVFGADGWSRHTAPNVQHLDRVGLVRRVMSSSYAPAAGTSAHAELVAALETALDRHAQDGAVPIG